MSAAAFVDAVTLERLEAFVSVRAATRALVGRLSQGQLDFSPGPGRWSIGEIADHLLLAEDLYRDMIAQLVAAARAGQPTIRRRSFADVNVSPLHLPDIVMSWVATPLGYVSRMMPDALIGLMTEFPILPTRNPDTATPRARRPAAELNRELGAGVARTGALIEGNADLDFNQLITEHPVMGRMNVAQLLTILARHERRHQRQMHTVRTDSRFPQA